MAFSNVLKNFVTLFWWEWCFCFCLNAALPWQLGCAHLDVNDAFVICLLWHCVTWGKMLKNNMLCSHAKWSWKNIFSGAEACRVDTCWVRLLTAPVCPCHACIVMFAISSIHMNMSDITNVNEIQFESCLDARVVMGVDLRSTGLQAAWVRTPLQATLPNFLHMQRQR